MIVYDDLGNGLIRAYSDNNKYLDERPTGVVGVYTEAVNKGEIIDGVGVFNNGYTYTENEKGIEENLGDNAEI